MDEYSSVTPAEPPEAARQRPAKYPENLFLNGDQLRSGWRLLIYVFLVAAISITLTFLLGQIAGRKHGGGITPWPEFLGESLSLLSTVIATGLMSLIEKRPLGTYGLPLERGIGKLFLQGSAFGLVEVSVLIGAIAGLGGYSLGSLAEYGPDILRWAVFWGVFFLVVGFFEEFFFRGYLLHTLAEGIGFWPAAVLLAATFGAVHLKNPGEGWPGAAGVFVTAVFWSFTLKRTGSLWFAVGMHAVFDFGETFLFSVPDSGMVFPGHLSNATLHGPSWLTGGVTGPEASVVDFLILFLFFLVFDRMYPARREQPSAMPTDFAG